MQIFLTRHLFDFAAVGDDRLHAYDGRTPTHDCDIGCSDCQHAIRDSSLVTCGEAASQSSHEGHCSSLRNCRFNKRIGWFSLCLSRRLTLSHEDAQLHAVATGSDGSLARIGRRDVHGADDTTMLVAYHADLVLEPSRMRPIA